MIYFSDGKRSCSGRHSERLDKEGQIHSFSSFLALSQKAIKKLTYDPDAAHRRVIERLEAQRKLEELERQARKQQDARNAAWRIQNERFNEPSHPSIQRSQPTPSKSYNDDLVGIYTGHIDEGCVFGTIASIAWSPNGRFIASGGIKGIVQIWNPFSGEYTSGNAQIPGRLDPSIPAPKLRNSYIRKLFGHQGAISAVVWSPDGRYIASGSQDDSTVKIWDALSGRRIREYPMGFGVLTAVWAPNGRFIASGGVGSFPGNTGALHIWEASSGNTVRKFDGKRIESLAWSPDSKYIVSGGNNFIRVLDAFSGRKICEYWTAGYVNSVSWSPDGRYIVSGTKSEDYDSVYASVKIHEAFSGKQIYEYSKKATAAWSPNGKYIAAGGDYPIGIHVLEALSGILVHEFQGIAESLTWSPDNRYIACQREGLVEIWKFTT